jgi:glycosyltransferase involved in cell wall biosynthesis
LIYDNSICNYRLKRQVFNSLKNLTIVPVSKWIAQITQESYLQNNAIHTISNGIDLSQFDIQSSDNVMQLKRHLGIKDEFVLLGVASIWDKRKGLSDFEKLSEIIPDEWKLVLVGLDEKQIKHLPSKIIGIKRTQSVRQLAELYSMATAFVNLTYEDTYPTTNLESIACGTPVITYRTGGSPESLTEHTGHVVNKGDINEVVKRVQCIIDNGPDHYKNICRDYALLHFNKEDKFKEYIELYKKILKQ